MVVRLRKALLILVTYNSYDLLPDLAESILQFVDDHPGNYVVVVENSSDPRVDEFIAARVRSDRVLVEVAATNEGFSPAVNFGFRHARDLWGDFDFITLLNPDVVSAGRTVAELVNRAAQNSESRNGIWGVVLRNERGDIDAGSARRAWNRRRFFSTYLLGYPPFASLLLSKPLSLTENEIVNDQTELSMISGALMCIRADIFGDGLDTFLPMYLEDQEICLRCRNRGYGIHIFSDLERVHVGAVSTDTHVVDRQALAVMTTVEAPIQCMVRLQGFSLKGMRFLVFIGGFSKLAVAPAVAGFGAVFRPGGRRGGWYAWRRKQVRLGAWLMLWAVKGTLHGEQVTLEEYFREYSRPDGNTVRAGNRGAV